MVMRKVMRRSNFTSVANLEDSLKRFPHYFNETLAHPFTWTYTGKPISRQQPTRFCPPHRRPKKSHWLSTVFDVASNCKLRH